LRERAAAFLAGTGQHDEDARVQKFLADLGHEQYAERGVLGGLQDQGVAGAEGGGDFQCAEKNGRIPGDDGADNTERFATGVAEDVFAEGNRFALELSGEAAEIAEDVGGERGFRAGLGAQGVAGFLGDNLGEFFDAGFHRLGDFQQQAAALAGCDLAPGGEGFVGGVDGSVDVFLGATRDGGDGGAACRVFDVQGRAGRAVDPGTVYQHANVAGLYGCQHGRDSSIACYVVSDIATV
jgi:hypothetical protein